MGQPDAEAVVVRHTPTHDILAHPRDRRWLLQEGGITVTQVFTLAVLCLLGLQGLKFIASRYDHLQIAKTMQHAVNEAPFSTDAAVVRTVLAKAKALQIPLDPRAIHLERSAHGGARLWAEYDVTVTFPLGFSHTQRFRPEVRAGRR